MKKLFVLLAVVIFLISPTFGETQPNKVYFDKQALDPVVQLINSAQQYICIEMYGFSNYKPVVDALIEAGKRGVVTTIILDNLGSNNPDNLDKDGNQTGCPEALLESNGIVVKWDKRSYLMHRKLLLVDREVVFMGSTNWSQNGFEKNREIDLCIVDKDLGEQIFKQFLLDWESAVDKFTDKKDEEPTPPPNPEPPAPPTEKVLERPINLKTKYVSLKVSLEWEMSFTSIEPSGYNVYRATGTDDYGASPINAKPMGSKMYFDSTAKAGFTYRYRVTALDKDGKETEPSSEVSIDIPIKLVSVKNLKAVKDGDSIILTWESEQPVGFIVKRNSLELTRTNDKTYTDTNPPSEVITYRVMAYKGTDIGSSTQVVFDNSKPKETPPEPEKEVQYIGNSNTKKFHYPSCRSVKDIKDSNKVYFYSRDEAINAGYSPCGICKP